MKIETINDRLETKLNESGPSIVRTFAGCLTREDATFNTTTSGPGVSGIPLSW